MIYDRIGMTSDNRDPKLMKFYSQFTTLMQDYYAERLSMFYVVHPNWIYKLAFAVIKPFLS